MRSLLITSLVVLLQLAIAPVLADDLDYERAIERAEEAYARGDLRAWHDIILPFAEDGDAKAQLTMSIIKELGVGFSVPNPSDEERQRESIMWLKRAAFQGYKDALVRLGDSYKNGWIGLPVNSVLSDCWHTAAEGRRRAETCVELEEQELGAPSGGQR